MTESAPGSGSVACDAISTPHSQFQEEIDDFLDVYLPAAPEKSGSRKIVHDGLWGTLSLDGGELAFVDTPLFQRLRQIRQTGFAFLTYPSTTHTRLEHVLGVVYQADKLGHALLKSKGDHEFAEQDIGHLRLAGLFHDLGHGPFSHTSEEIYGDLSQLDELRGSLKDAKPHEILTYLILVSQRFRSFFRDVYPDDTSIDEIAGYIVGSDLKADRKFKREILNGPFDADKLDYFFRDSHFSGLPLAVDMDRLCHTMRIANVKGEPRLVVTQSGATPLEQILFSRMVLSTTVYQHHKIRACDCMFAGIIEYMKRTAQPMRFGKRDLDWSSPVHFLWVTENEFHSLGCRTEDARLHDLIHNLFYRRLLKRAMIISRHTVKMSDNDRWDELQRLAKRGCTNARRKIARTIWENAGKPCLPEEVWLDLPELPNMKSADDTYVLQSEDQTSEPISLNEHMPIGQWVKNYGEQKWRGHIFCPAECRDRVAKAAKSFFETEYKVRILPAAFEWCKVHPPT
ncbi:MAG: hypothetical protein C0404_05600 [Verrucomicrobia bacterium]|nr:hypothetical protein [Verrucomicrobiota bacterium]